MNVQLKYRLYRRNNGTFYWQENEGVKQASLKTKDKREAAALLHAMNEAHRQPTLTLAVGRAYLAAHDPKMIKRSWQAVMDEMATHGIPTTQERCARALRSKAYNAIRHKPLVETTGEDLLTIMHANGNCVGHYLRRLHNLALNLGWLAWPILAKAAWPKIRSQSKRGVTPEEHAKIIGSERNPERRTYYELLYETGAAQTDAANLSAKHVENGVLVYRRKKLGPTSEPARLTIGPKLNALLQSLPLHRRPLSEDQTNLRQPSLRRIPAPLPHSRNRGHQLAQLSLCMGAAGQILRLSATVRPGGIGPRQQGGSRRIRQGRGCDLPGLGGIRGDARAEDCAHATSD